METNERIIFLSAVLGIILGSFLAGWYYYMSVPIDYGSFQIEFMLVDEDDTNRVYDISKTFTVSLAYSRFERQQEDKHLEFVYYVPDAWIANSSGNRLLIHFFNNDIDEGAFGTRHYAIEKVDNRELWFGLLVGVIEYRTPLEVGENYTMTIWEIGTGPFPEIGF